MKKQTLEQWIAEAMLDTDKEGPCTMIALVHKVGVSDEEIHHVSIGAAHPKEPKELAKLFRGKADSYCQDLVGVQTCCLIAFYNNRSEPQARHSFTLHGEMDFGGLATEAPTSNGMVQQMMRHNEALMQMAIKGNMEIVGRMPAIIDNLTKENARLTDENADAYALVKELTMEKVVAEAKAKINVIDHKHDREERTLLIRLLPALANTISGEKIFAESVEDTALLETIAESIDEKEISALQNVLRPELFAPVAARFAEILRKKREAKQLTQGDPNTAEDELH
ncbi:MAG: hypothetical protein ACREBG_12425 [Pyrinomonadaceae bacterium]